MRRWLTRQSTTDERAGQPCYGTTSYGRVDHFHIKMKMLRRGIGGPARRYLRAPSRQIILPKTSASGNWYRDAVHPCSQNSGCTVPTPFGGIQTPTNENCPFCRKRDTAIRYQNAAGFAFLDSFPISNGYMLGRSRSGHLRRREAVAGDPSPEASAMPTRLPSDLVAGWKPES